MMGKYCYVRIENIYDAAFSKALKGVVANESMYYSGPSIAYLQGVKRDIKKVHKKGLIFEYDVDETVYTRVPMVCEYKTDAKGRGYFVDIVSGKSFWAKNYNENTPTAQARLTHVRDLTTKETAEHLKSLKDEDIIRYIDRMNEFINQMKVGYSNYLSRVASENRELSDAEEYIKRFRDKHGR